jgi:hypothetical protein
VTADPLLERVRHLKQAVREALKFPPTIIKDGKHLFIRLGLLKEALPTQPSREEELRR